MISVVCNGVDAGRSYSRTLELQHIDGGVSTWFTMPEGNVSLEINVAVDGAVPYEVSFSGDKCDHALLTSSGGQSGRAIQAAAGETITVTVVPLPGYDLLSMSYTTRSNPVSVPLACARNEDGSFTAEIVMPDEPLYITADGSQTAVPYVSYDAGGVSQGEQTCDEYLAITDSSANWYDINDQTGGWYVVRGNVTLSANTTLHVTGDVHLVLCDGAKLTAGDGVYIRQGSSLSIYGQSVGTGKLVAKPESGPGIGGMANTVGGSLYIHGGVIEARAARTQPALAVHRIITITVTATAEMCLFPAVLCLQSVESMQPASEAAPVGKVEHSPFRAARFTPPAGLTRLPSAAAMTEMAVRSTSAAAASR